MGKPMTTCELFNKIRDILEGEDLLPDILDCALANGETVPIKTNRFKLKGWLSYGDGEGICVYFWIEYSVDGKHFKNDLGSFRTSRDDSEAIYLMASMMSDFIVSEYIYVNANPGNFTWEGAGVYPAGEP